VKKKKSQPRRSCTWDAISIMNAQGEPWTRQVWLDEADALAYLKHYQTRTGVKLPKHKAVAVRITVRIPKSSQ